MKRFKFSISLLFFIALATVTLYAQPGGGGSSGGGSYSGSQSSSYQQNSSTRQTTSVLDDDDVKNINEEEESKGKSTSTDYVGMAGLFEIDPAVVIKKCGIKDKALSESVSAVLLEYKNLSGRIETEFSKEVAQLRKAEIDAKTGTTPNKVVITETTQTIKKRSVLIHKRLSDSMTKTLSAKEVKKWNALYTKMCEEKGFSTDLR